ncbi:hypothetical protein NS226_03830 [Aureimonas ureilytica]|uniref:Uncharacterized protein n=1 Tax=Aureimonas ureilytica TaxID=401562 RepID=A0A175REK6_9HYPH|nr:hypothetical protein [Aureimonas ureilytica]KTQ97781.1 hypothetical protein NS226_03830 [Aureimonas ureilytica]
MSQRLVFTFDGLAGLALRRAAAHLGRSVEELVPFRFELDRAADGEPIGVLTVNTDRDPVAAEEFEPS